MHKERTSVRLRWAEGVLDENELLVRAKTYREMASTTTDMWFRLELTARAERYETVVEAIRRARSSAAADHERSF